MSRAEAFDVPDNNGRLLLCTGKKEIELVISFFNDDHLDLSSLNGFGVQKNNNEGRLLAPAPLMLEWLSLVFAPPPPASSMQRRYHYV